MTGYQRILALVELDNDDLRVLRRAAQLGRWSGAPLLILHVLDYGPGFECDQAPVLTRAQVEASLVAAAQEHIALRLQRLAIGSARTLVLQGKPWDVAATVAREWQADLVVCSAAARYRLDRARPAFDVERGYDGEVLSTRTKHRGFGARLRAWLQPLWQF